MNDLKNQIDTISQENQKLNERYNFFRTRFNDISKKSNEGTPLVTSTNVPNILKETLIKSLQKLDLLKKEKEFYSRKKNKIIKLNDHELEFQKKQIESKIKQISAENEKLKKIEGSDHEINEQERKILQKIETYKKKIAELETQHEKNQKIIKDLDKKLKEINEEKKNGKPTEEDSNPESDTEKSFQKLCKMEKYLNTCIKSNDAKYRQKLKEYENIEQKLNSDKICLQMKILKTTQQERLLELTLSQNKEGNSSENKYNDANFLYKPSIKALYS